MSTHRASLRKPGRIDDAGWRMISGAGLRDTQLDDHCAKHQVSHFTARWRALMMARGLPNKKSKSGILDHSFRFASISPRSFSTSSSASQVNSQRSTTPFTASAIAILCASHAASLQAPHSILADPTSVVDDARVELRNVDGSVTMSC